MLHAMSRAPINSRPISVDSSTNPSKSLSIDHLRQRNPQCPSVVTHEPINVPEKEPNDTPRHYQVSKVDVYVPMLSSELIENKLDLLASDYEDGTSISSDDLVIYENEDGGDFEIEQSPGHETGINSVPSSLGTLHLDRLEEEEVPSPGFATDVVKNNYEAMLDILNDVVVSSKYEPTSQANSIQSSSMNMNDKASNKSKLEDLMSYLDIVEMDTEPSEKSSRVELNECNAMEYEVLEILKRPPKKLAEEIIILKLKIEDHIRSEKSLEEELLGYKDSVTSSSAQFQKELKHRLKMQKQEYDSAISRHQNFIDQLIEDKKTLRDQVDGLLAEQGHLEKKFEDGVKCLESRHTAEIRRLKSLYESSSKLKQEKWLDEKTKRIKEQTVKGLEPELQRLVARHGEEVKKLEADKIRCLQVQERELHQRHLQHVQELRSIWDHEQVELIQRERELLHNRHTQYLTEIRCVHTEELDRIQGQLTRERDRGMDERGHFEREAEQIRRISQTRANDEIDRIREEEENKRRTLTKKHANELSLLRENEQSDRLEWERNCRERLDEEWRLREEAIRRTITSQKEEELKEAMTKCDNRMAQCKEQAHSEVQERIARQKERYEVEIKDLKDEVEAIRDAQAKTRDELRKKEEESLVLMAMLKQKELYAEEVLKINSKLESERDQVRKAVRGEFTSTIDSLTQEKNSLLGEMSSLRIKISELNTKIENNKAEMRIQKEEDAERIHSRVKSAISRKDEAINELKKQLDKSHAERENLEALLRRHAEVKYLRNKQ